MMKTPDEDEQNKLTFITLFFINLKRDI